LLTSSTNDIQFPFISFRLNKQWRSSKPSIELLEAISNGIRERGVYAVRSSGTFEDGERTSSAGQYATVLGCTGRPADVVAAVLECWSSNFSARALTYRKYVQRFRRVVEPKSYRNLFTEKKNVSLNKYRIRELKVYYP